MKKLLILVFILLVNLSFAVGQIVSDTVDMQGGYTNDIYYNLEDGAQYSVSNSNWTVAFSTGSQTASIIINGGKGVQLWETDVAVADFDLVDTSMISTWTEAFDNDSFWSRSAFEYSATGHPNYGWGNYNSSNHIIFGNKIFVIKTLNNNFFKVHVVQKELGAITYRYASIDNSMDTVLTYQASDLVDKNYVFLNMDDFTFNDREPAVNDWDLLFTRYYPNDLWGTGERATGVFVHPTIEVAKVANVPTATSSLADASYIYNKSEIGYNWKSFDFMTNTFTLINDLSYFVRLEGGDVFKLVFNRFDGQSTGIAGFTKEFVGNITSLSDNNTSISDVVMYPNPSSAETFLIFESAISSTEASIEILDLSGKTLAIYPVSVENGLNKLPIDVSNLAAGMYLIQLNNSTSTVAKPLIVSH